MVEGLLFLRNRPTLVSQTDGQTFPEHIRAEPDILVFRKPLKTHLFQGWIQEFA